MQKTQKLWTTKMAHSTNDDSEFIMPNLTLNKKKMKRRNEHE